MLLSSIVEMQVVFDFTTAIVLCLAVIEVAWVAYQVNVVGPHRAKRTVREVMSEPATISPIVETLAERMKPGSMRGGVDPYEMISIREAKKAEKQAMIEATRAEIFAHLVQRFGPVQARTIQAWIPKETLDAAANSLDKWRFLLEPIIKAGEAHARNQHPERGASPGSIPEY